MELPGTNEAQRPSRKFDNAFASFLEKYQQLNLNAGMFVYLASSNHAQSLTAEAIDDVIAKTAIATDGSPQPPHHPDVIAFRNGSLVALEVVTSMYPNAGWDNAVASLCKEVTYNTSLTVIEQYAQSLSDASSRRYMREQMLLRSYAGRKNASNFSEIVPELAHATHPQAVVAFENGFCFVANAVSRYEESCDDFARQAQGTLETNEDSEILIDNLIHQILSKDKYTDPA
jgi:hypothetical protein